MSDTYSRFTNSIIVILRTSENSKQREIVRELLDPTLLILGVMLILFGFPIVFLIFYFSKYGAGKKAGNSSDVVREREIIVKEIVMIPCQYCGGFMPQTSTFCPSCGAKRIA